jgi:hypothetical protein
MTRSSRSLVSRETPSPPSWRAKCRSGFTTLPPVPLQEQPAVVLLLEGLRSHKVLVIREYGGIRRFTWFGPPERNTLRPRVNGVVLLCLSARLRSSFVCLCVCLGVYMCVSVCVRGCVSARTFYSSRPSSYSETPWPDRWPRGW